MLTTADWHRSIFAEFCLPPGAARVLLENGFVVLPGPAIPGGLEQLSRAYDHAVATADPEDVRIGSSIRVDDFVNRGPEFDGLYIYGPVLAACALIIGGPFKLSGLRARTLEPGARAQPLHVDVKHRANGWPLVGCILMVDGFDAENGATRFVPGSHLQPSEPAELLSNLTAPHAEEVLACGPQGSLIIFNASVWHGYTANRSTRRRRSIQGHFVPRDAFAATDHAARMRPETLQRIGDLAKYIHLGCGQPAIWWSRPKHFKCLTPRRPSPHRSSAIGGSTPGLPARHRKPGETERGDQDTAAERLGSAVSAPCCAGRSTVCTRSTGNNR